MREETKLSLDWFAQSVLIVAGGLTAVAFLIAFPWLILVIAAVILAASIGWLIYRTFQGRS